VCISALPVTRFSVSNRTRDQSCDEFPSRHSLVSDRAAWMDVQILRVDKRAWCVHKAGFAVPGGLVYRAESGVSKVYTSAADACNSRPLRHRLYWKVMFQAKTGSFSLFPIATRNTSDSLTEDRFGTRQFIDPARMTSYLMSRKYNVTGEKEIIIEK